MANFFYYLTKIFKNLVLLIGFLVAAFCAVLFAVVAFVPIEQQSFTINQTVIQIPQEIAQMGYDNALIAFGVSLAIFVAPILFWILAKVLGYKKDKKSKSESV